jgi:autonomous glycyl radical cofactor GrcA
MLRFFVILLLLANGAYFAWSRGYLAVLGLAPVSQSEPARMQAQIKPEAMRPIGSNDARRMEVATAPTPPAPAKPAECLQSSLLSEKLAQAVRAAAEALPTGSWALDSAEEPARWIVYMGKYNAPDVLAKKKSELRQLGVDYEPLLIASLEPGISLGGHATQAEATRELADLNKRGVRTAKVVQEKLAVKGQVLRLPAVDDALRGQLDGVRAALGSAALRSCKVS